MKENKGNTKENKGNIKERRDREFFIAQTRDFFSAQSVGPVYKENKGKMEEIKGK